MSSKIHNALAPYFGDIRYLNPLSGGDINEVYSFESNDIKYCLKVNDALSFPGMFSAEAKGLDLLRASNSFRVPKVIQQFDSDEQSFLVLEFIHSGRKDKHYAERFTRNLYELHSQTHAHFGLDHDNYIGSIQQKNTSCDTWGEFYGEMRLNTLARICFDRELLSHRHIAQLNTLCLQLNEIFPQEAPSLLHGDLWGGNAMSTINGNACIYDPAVYYGHREMDLGMMKLFGGFEDAIFDAYQAIAPLAPDWENRIELTQLYPLMVHLILFGRSYFQPIDKTLRKF